MALTLFIGTFDEGDLHELSRSKDINRVLVSGVGAGITLINSNTPPVAVVVSTEIAEQKDEMARLLAATKAKDIPDPVVLAGGQYAKLISELIELQKKEVEKS